MKIVIKTIHEHIGHVIMILNVKATIVSDMWVNETSVGRILETLVFFGVISVRQIRPQLHPHVQNQLKYLMQVCNQVSQTRTR